MQYLITVASELLEWKVNECAQAGGPSYAVELGRLDGLRSTASSVNGKLPAPFFNLDQLSQMFAANGLSQADMIALSGARPSIEYTIASY